MTIDKERVLHIVDDWILNRYGNRILSKDGKIDMNAVIALVKQDYGDEAGIREIESDDIIIDVSENNTNDDEIIKFLFDEEALLLYVPKELRERIQFETEYILSGFDKVQNAVADLSKEFQLNRMGAVANAEKELRNCGNEFTKDSRQIIIGCINDVGIAIEQIKGSIISLCDRIEAIPRDRKKRLFTTPINKVLGDVNVGRKSVYDYIYSSAVYAELNMKIGRKNAAVDRLQEAIDFLLSMCEQGRFERIEQWNEKKDLFWEEGIDEQIETLKKELVEIKNFSGEIML